MKYTITRALAELKLLKARCKKETDQLEVIAVKHGSRLRSPYSAYKEEDFKKAAKSDYQSVCDLEKRILEIKNKIDISNFTTKVTVGDTEMTIQEALNYKNTILAIKDNRLSILKARKYNAKNEYDRALAENNNMIARMSSDKNNSGSAKDSSDIEEDARGYVEKAHAVSLVDPIIIDEEIKKLEKEISDFTNNIDFVLSESNSTTFIEVSD